MKWVVTLIAIALVSSGAASKKSSKVTPTAIPAAMPVVSAPIAPAKLSYLQASPDAEKPFWKSKPDLMKKMVDDRSIVVSVHRDEAKNGDAVFTMAGAGIVARNKDSVFKVAQDYSKLKDVSDHFQTVTFDPSNQQLFIVTQALGYQARMIMQLTTVSEDWRSEVQWEVIWGSFKGMKGVIGYEKIGPRSTEVSFTGKFQAKELPIPKIIMSFALEVVTQKVAENMRNYLEQHTL